MDDRPLECSACKKPGSVNYIEIVGKKITRTIMCSDCPVLANKMQGAQPTDMSMPISDKPSRTVCKSCGTTAEEIAMGYHFGCAECYTIFSDVVVSQILSQGGVASFDSCNASSYHKGRSPGEIREITPSMRLIVLNEALKETLNREDYEQAAWIRDQIKQIEDGVCDDV